MALISVTSVAAVYLLFLAWRLGVHQRLPLALGRISLEAIPDRAARRHGERPLFTTDESCAWSVPALAGRYPDPRTWSAVRIKATAALLARMLRERLDICRGDRVAIVKTNHLDVHVLIAAVVRAGGVACPINGRFAAGHLRPYLLNIGAKVLISDVATLGRLLEEAAEFGPVERVVIADHRAPGDARAGAMTALL
ncbi:MAG TPA: AMP-binding protein, partial [Vicinamibacterales bacterium]|nr:AMP-binding protein [Vicinamibacterales bacterium]